MHRLGRVLAGANRHDSPLLAPTLDRLDGLSPLPGNETPVDLGFFCFSGCGVTNHVYDYLSSGSFILGPPQLQTVVAEQVVSAIAS